MKQMSRITLPYRKGIANNSSVSRALFNSWHEGHKEVCLSSGRGCGKSVDLILYALHLMSWIPKFRVVWARTEYATIKSTIIETLQHVIFRHPMGDSRNIDPRNNYILHGGVRRPSSLEIPANGSEMSFIGLDTKSKTRGLACDLGILNEGTREETDEVWGEMGAVQSGGRGGAWWVKGMPFNQLITDTNPSSPYHWIYKLFRSSNKDKCDVGIYHLPEDRLWLGYDHTDNPLHRNVDGTLNDIGKQKVYDLERFYQAGFDRQRMVYHQWCSAEGIVYSGYKPEVHEVEMHASDFASDSSWFIGLDLGGTDPFAFCLLNFDSKGTQRIFKEGVRSQCLLEDVENDMLISLGAARIGKEDVTVVSDINVPEFIKRLRANGWNVIEAEKGPGSIESRVDLGKKTINTDNLYVNKASLLETDKNYKGPQGFKQEVLGYQYHPEDKQAKMKNPNVPIDKNDHSMNAWEYLNKHLVKETGYYDYTPRVFTM